MAPSCMRLGNKFLFLTTLINLCPKFFVDHYICGLQPCLLLDSSSPPASVSSSQSIPQCSPIKYVPLSPPISHSSMAELPRRCFSSWGGKVGSVLGWEQSHRELFPKNAWSPELLVPALPMCKHRGWPKLQEHLSRLIKAPSESVACAEF